MDPRSVDSEGYSEDHPPPSYYGEQQTMGKVQVGAPLLPDQAHYTHTHQPGQMGQPMPRPGDQVTVVTMAPKPGAEVEEAFGCCHVACAFCSVFLCTFFGLIALLLAQMGYTDYRTGNFKLFKKKKKCVIALIVISWISFGILVGVMYYLRKQAEAQIRNSYGGYGGYDYGK